MIAAGALPGEPIEPVPAGVEVVAGRDDRDDAGARGVVDRLDDDVARRLDLGLAEREVDHVHPVRDRLVDRLGDLRRVAVEPEARASARSAPCSCRGMRVGATPEMRLRPAAIGRRVVVAGRDAGDVRRVLGVQPGSNGVSAYFHVASGGGNARATITFGVV